MAFGCRQDDSSGGNSSEVKSVVEGNTAFALDLYQRLKEQPGNVCFSPYSVSTALAMAYAGARGRTETEMANALHFNLSPDELHNGLAAVAARLEEIDGRNAVKLATANSLWYQRNYRVSGAFLDLVRTRYKADVEPVDFRDAGATASSRINAWVERKSRAKIRDLMKSDGLGPDARLVLCNVIYFKGTWATRFDAKATRPEPFFLSAKETRAVPMMFQDSKFKTVEVAGLSLLALPYTGDDLSMIILLPHARDGLGELERQLNPRNLSHWIGMLDCASAGELSVALPRFTTTHRLSLANDLAFLGMPTAFGKEADFSGLNAQRELYLSDVIHETFVELNEEGTKAAAATTVHAYLKGISRIFDANHPFIFLIRENRTGSILFLGRIVDPSR
jgi:serpin B